MESQLTAGPLRTATSLACEACRLRRVKCVPAAVSSSSSSTTCTACIKKGITCVFVERPLVRTRNRSGKNVEAARARYGSTSSGSTGGTPAYVGLGTAPLIVAQDKLVQEELVGAFGNRLFELWLDQRGERETCPPLDYPVVDFVDLWDRFHQSGHRLDALDAADQLLCRTVYAVAAPVFLPAETLHLSRHDVSRKLLSTAENQADNLAIWRKPSLRHAGALLLLFKARGTEDWRSVEARPYVVASTEQMRTLFADALPQDMLADEEGITRAAWCTVVADALVAAETRKSPRISRREATQWLRQGQAVSKVLDCDFSADLSSSQQTMERVFGALFYLVMLAHDVSELTMHDDQTGSVFDFCAKADRMYSWAEAVLDQCWGADGEGANLCRVFGGVLWLATIMLEFSVSEHVSSLVAQAALRGSQDFHMQDTQLLSQLVQLSTVMQGRISMTTCNFLEQSRRKSPVYTLAISAGVGTSVSRVLDFVQAFLGASELDSRLFSRGATEKLESLESIRPQLRRLYMAYPSDRMQRTLDAMDSERARLRAGSPASSHGWASTASAGPSEDPGYPALLTSGPQGTSQPIAALDPALLDLNGGIMSDADWNRLLAGEL